jgi:hypothetical protein
MIYGICFGLLIAAVVLGGWQLTSKQHRKVRIHMKGDGPSIEGVLAGRTRREYILWAPKVLTGEDEHPEVEVSGHVEIPRENVQWYQVVG